MVLGIQSWDWNLELVTYSLCGLLQIISPLRASGFFTCKIPKKVILEIK